MFNNKNTIIIVCIIAVIIVICIISMLSEDFYATTTKPPTTKPPQTTKPPTIQPMTIQPMTNPPTKPPTTNPPTKPPTTNPPTKPPTNPPTNAPPPIKRGLTAPGKWYYYDKNNIANYIYTTKYDVEKDATVKCDKGYITYQIKQNQYTYVCKPSSKTIITEQALVQLNTDNSGCINKKGDYLSSIKRSDPTNLTLIETQAPSDGISYFLNYSCRSEVLN
jgi:hypothetical protein